MASKKMTFSFPEELADRFTRRVPAQDRSRYMAEALSEKLGRREHELRQACRAANADPDIAAMEDEFDRIDNDITEPWNDAPAG